jgi:hypothetical protein
LADVRHLKPPALVSQIRPGAVAATVAHEDVIASADAQFYAASGPHCRIMSNLKTPLHEFPLE